MELYHKVKNIANYIEICSNKSKMFYAILDHKSHLLDLQNMVENQLLNSPNIEESLTRVQSEKGLWRDLVEMGFDANMVDAVLYFYSVKELNSLILLLIKTEEGYFHIFIPDENNSDPCLICNEGIDQHNSDTIDVSEFQAHESYQVSLIKIRETPNIQIQPNSGFEVECEICYMKYRAGTIITLQCDHKFCRKCLNSYLSLEINEGRVLEIRCCQADCELIFEESIIQSVLDDAILEKYCRFKRSKLIESDPESRWCPNIRCRHMVKRKDKTSKYLKCKRCDTEICFECKEVWHPELTCDKASEKTYEEWAKGKEIQKCPKCKVRIEKVSGCNHITCVLCRYQWCWICRRKYNRFHFDRLNLLGCPGLQD